MKKIFFFVFLAMSISFSFAATHIVQVSNFQFSPKRVNAKVGDKIKFVWVNGVHTTTSTSVPAGAASWDRPISTSNKTFVYTITKTGTYNYLCSIHASIMKGVIKVTAALSAGLADFEVEESESAKSVINWKTSSEKDIDYYSIQRSTDGENFLEIARVKPENNLNNVQLHQYIDNNLTGNNKYVYYMLEMVDKKGNTQLSPIKMHIQDVKAANLIVSLSPNPVSRPGHLMVQFNSSAQGMMLVQLYNQSGKLIKQTEMTAVRGVNNGHFHLGDITPGTYYLVCTLGSIKQKSTVIVK